MTHNASTDEHTSVGQRLRDILAPALACALVGGLLHAAISWFRRAVLHDLLRTWMSPDIAWMAPLGYCLVFVPAAAVLVGAAFAWRRMPALRLSALVFGTLAAFSVILLFPRLHQYAALALGLGVGIRFSSLVAARVEVWRARLWRVGLASSVLTLALFGYQTGRRVLGERGMIAALPAAPAAAPNVLFIILDTVRASALSLYGAARPTTPKLVEFARTGTTFDWAFSTAPWTLPSHASMFTGRYSSQQSGNWTTPLDGATATLADVFASNGYATGGFTANLVATPRGFGLERGFSRYEDHRHSLSQMVLSTSLGQANSFRNAWQALTVQHWPGRALRELARFDFEPRYSYPDNDPKPAEEITSSFLRWQRAHSGRPFFAFLNFFDAHGPYDSPARYDTLFGKSDRARDKYDRSIRYLDDALGALFDSLSARAVLDQTIVIVASDHGEQFGEHGLGWHSNSLYAQLTHVPLVIRYPGRVPAGVRVAQQVSLRDLAATLTDLSGFTDSRGLEGTSLAAAWLQPGARTSAALSELSRGINVDAKSLNAQGDMRAVADDSLHYIRNGNGMFEMYAYRRDGAETQDLAKGVHRALASAYDSAITTALALPRATRTTRARP